MIYEIRLKGRQKQGECSAILTMTFLIIALSIFSLNLIPLVYVSAIKPMLSGEIKEIGAIAVSASVLLTLRVICMCLSFGCDRFMLKRAEDRIAGAGDIFRYFTPSEFTALCAFSLRFTLYKLLMLTVSTVPFMISGYLCFCLCDRGFSAVVCGIFAAFTGVFFMIGIGTYSKIRDTLFLVRYRYIKGEYINFRQLIAQSQSDMKERADKLRQLKVSFAGWFLLSLLIIPLPYVWCYYRQTKACFAAE